MAGAPPVIGTDANATVGGCSVVDVRIDHAARVVRVWVVGAPDDFTLASVALIAEWFGGLRVEVLPATRGDEHGCKN